MNIPTKFLSKMGDYDIVLDGVPLKAKVVDDQRVLDMLIPYYFDTEDDILGLDLKTFTPKSIVKHTFISDSVEILVICGASQCLITHLNYVQYTSALPESLRKFLENSYDTSICFVRASMKSLPRPPFGPFTEGVGSGELASRVLKKPGLKGLSFEAIAREVGVPYANVYASSDRDKSGSILVDTKYENVLTPEQVKMVAYDAFTCYRIGAKLLSSLK